MKKNLLYTMLIASLFWLSACEKAIPLDLPAGKPLPYIDAWITDQPGIQTIQFLNAANYLDSGHAAPVTGAQITLTDLTDAKIYPFNYSNGAYSYDAGTAAIGIVNHRYKLSILYSGQQFEAVDTMKRV